MYGDGETLEIVRTVGWASDSITTLEMVREDDTVYVVLGEIRNAVPCVIARTRVRESRLEEICSGRTLKLGARDIAQILFGHLGCDSRSRHVLTEHG